MKFIKITVDSPEDILYPCGKKLFEDLGIFYHGTSSVYAPSIEKEGWIPNALPYDMKDVRIICNIYESLAFYGSTGKGYPVLKACTLGNGSYVRYKPASFSGSYWRARAYAVRPGGETLDNIIFALRDLQQLLLNAEGLEAHKRALKSQFDERKNYSNHVLSEYQSAIELIDKQNYLSKCLKQASTLEQKYVSAFERHQPVVYFLRIDKSLFETHSGMDWSETSNFDRQQFERMVEVRPKRNARVSPECIEARIDFPKGAKWWLPLVGEPLPLPWTTPPVQLKELWEKHQRTFGPIAD